MARRKAQAVKPHKNDVSSRKRKPISGVFRLHTGPGAPHELANAVDDEWSRLADEATPHWFVNVG